jgi:hypothetical protein
LVLRRRLAATALILGVAATAAYLVYLGLVERRAFLPGPLHAAHAYLEHDCDACHVSWKGVSAAKCAACHVDARGAPVAFAGFAKHHADAALDCLACHTDHKGRRGETTTETREAYRASCEKCHAGYEKQAGPFQGVLAWRHADHTAAKGLACERCHDADPSERAHHGQVTIKRPDCFDVGCHLAPLRKEKGFVLPEVTAAHAAWKNDCFACHTWLGKIDAGKCAACHDDGKGGTLALKGFASHHATRGLDCARCHLEHPADGKTTLRETQADYEKACILCHDGYEKEPHTIRGEVFVHTSHGEKQKLACADCHDVRRDAAEHGKVTLAENACVGCHLERDHPGRAVLAEPWREVATAHAPWEKDCARCHAAAADVRGSLCADCHKTPDGRDIAWRGFAKHHLDPTLACAECHTEHKGREGVKTTLAEAKWAERCTLCHGQYASFEGQVDGHPFKHKGHTPENGLACAQCHDAREDAGAAHGKLTITTAQCAACHLAKRADAPVGALAKGHAALTDCAACHRDWHEADAKLCRSCHMAEAEKKASAAGGSTAAPAKLFPGHALDEKLACLACHTEHKGAAGTERLPAEARTETCLRCHAAPGGGTYVQPAERSPGRLPAGDPLAGAPREVRFDHGRHVSVACERCHDAEPRRHARAPGDAPLPLLLRTGDCISCHHAPDQKKDCASCHDEEARFRGGALPGSTVSAPADAHTGLVQCGECHVRDARGLFRPTREQCVRCHGEDFGKLYDTARAALAAALGPGTKPATAALVRRYGMHNVRLARALLSPDGSAGR